MSTPATVLPLLCKAHASSDINHIIELVDHDGGAHWRALGDEDDNVGTVGQSSNPALAIVERVTNAIDAMLELKALERNERLPRSPRLAAQEWFGIPERGLGAMHDVSRRVLAETSIRVWLEASGIERRPTIRIEDSGAGEHPTNFPNTLMSIHRGNKRDKFYLMGQYGQGGSTTYGFAGYTLVISRRHPHLLTAGQKDVVGWTVVRYNELDPDLFKTGRYEYLVRLDGDVPSFAPEAISPEFAPGTTVVHVSYDLHGYAEAYTQLGNSIWALFHAALFDPVLPFQIGGHRDKDLRVDPKASTVGRIVIGNYARLSSPGRATSDVEVIAGDPFQINISPEMGFATVRYWVVRRPEVSERSTPPAEAYVRADSAVTMTLFGQRQDTASRTWLKENTRLPYLSRNLIAQVEGDSLTAKAKRELFATTREAAKRGELKDRIYSVLAEELAKNQDLRALEEEEKERSLAQGARRVSERIRRRLAKLIKTRIPGLYKEEPTPGGHTTVPPTRRRRKKRRPWIPKPAPDDSMLPTVPTYLEIKTKPVRIEQGRTAVVRIAVNAKNDYLPAHDSDLSFRFSGDVGHLRVRSRSFLRGGETRWTLECDHDCPLGKHQLSLRLKAGGRVLRDTTTAEVVPRKLRGGIERQPETGPDIRWLKEEGWPDYWDGDTVGEVNEGDAVEILLNEDFDPLAREIHKPGLGPGQVRVRQERYLYPVACTLYYHHAALKQIPTDRRPSEAYIKGELARMAQAVLMTIWSEDEPTED